jgi:hypothetical protein
MTDLEKYARMACAHHREREGDTLELSYGREVGLALAEPPPS